MGQAEGQVTIFPGIHPYFPIKFFVVDYSPWCMFLREGQLEGYLPPYIQVLNQ